MKTIFEGELIRLRPLKESDEEAVFNGARQEEVVRYTPSLLASEFKRERV